MSYNEFFTDKDKPYSENLNDALCLVDAFDLTVPLNMPAGFSNGEFSSNIGITKKCGVGLVTLMSRDSGVTIGTDSIAGSGEVVFRIYPNFNSFYKWSKILLTKTGNVTIGFRRVDGTDISVTVDSDGNISDNTDLRELKEIDLVLTLSSATISQVLVWFVNDQTAGRVRSSALLEASQLANVNGQVVTGNTEAVNGGTVKTALDSLHSTVTDEIEDLEDSITGETNARLVLKEDKSNKVTVLDSNSSHYPSCTAVNNGLALKEMLSNKVTSLDSSDSHYPSSKAVKTVTDSKANKEWTTVPTTKGTLEVNESLKLAHFVYSDEITSSTGTWVTIQENNIPAGYCPRRNISKVGFTGANHFITSVEIDKNGTLRGYISSASSAVVSIDTLWKYQ